jgi:nuclear transport factor 2 (NTF2) superfamily protein
METRTPLPPFSLATAVEKVRLAEDGWNTRDAAKVALAYTPDTKWRNRAEFVRIPELLNSQSCLSNNLAVDHDWRRPPVSRSYGSCFL